MNYQQQHHHQHLTDGVSCGLITTLHAVAQPGFVRPWTAPAFPVLLYALAVCTL